MTQDIFSHQQMAHVRRSLAEAGIYFDKLCINQAYFNSQVTVHHKPTNLKQKKSKSHSFWHKLFCGSDIKRSTMSNQTALTVRDDCDAIASASALYPCLTTSEHIHDRRRRPMHQNKTHAKDEAVTFRRRNASAGPRTSHSSYIRETLDDADDEFTV